MKKLTAKITKTTSKAKQHKCLCGCGQRPRSINSLFVQGHDMRLRSKIAQGKPVSKEAAQYALDNWGIDGAKIKSINTNKSKRKKAS